jgi:hypothetical protein
MRKMHKHMIKIRDRISPDYDYLLWLSEKLPDDETELIPG